MHLTQEQIQQTPRIKRLNLINSITGVKPANLIGTVSDDGHTNLAVFSSIVHLGSNPALLGFVLRPQHEVRRDTYDNILQNKCYTINHIHTDFIETLIIRQQNLIKMNLNLINAILLKNFCSTFKHLLSRKVVLS